MANGWTPLRGLPSSLPLGSRIGFTQHLLNKILRRIAGRSNRSIVGYISAKGFKRFDRRHHRNRIQLHGSGNLVWSGRKKEEFFRSNDGCEKRVACI